MVIIAILLVVGLALLSTISWWIYQDSFPSEDVEL